MKIAIDASRLRPGMTGAGRYAAGLLAPLDEEMPEASFILYTRRDCSVDPPSPRWTVRYDRHPIWSRLPVTWWIHHRLGTLIRGDKPDVFWGPNTLVPRGLVSSIPCVTSVLDFNHVLVPETLPPLTRYAHRRWMDADVRAATRNVAISKGTAVRMRQLLGRSPDAIAYPSVPAIPAVTDYEAALRSLEIMGVRRPFLLTVGSRAPRKNLTSVVSAVAMLKARKRLTDYQLVMAGPDSWNKRNRILERGTGTEWIKPLGFVDDTKLAALYTFADALVFPSLYEGFGMPVIEARAFGCRVVTTDSPELREAGGEDATYVLPTAEGVAAGLERALALPKPSLHHVEFDSRTAAHAVASAIREAVDSVHRAG